MYPRRLTAILTQTETVDDIDDEWKNFEEAVKGAAVKSGKEEEDQKKIWT